MRPHAACRLVDDDETGSFLIHCGAQGACFAFIERRKGGLRPDILNDTDATLGDSRRYLCLAWLLAPWQKFIRHHVGDADHTKKAFELP